MKILKPNNFYINYGMLLDNDKYDFSASFASNFIYYK